MSLLKSNLELLSHRQPELARHLGALPSHPVEVFPSAAGMPTARYHRDGSATLLHSRYQPVREARQVVQSTDLAGADYFVLLGFGLGYILDALLEQNPDRTAHYFVVESDPALLKAAFASRDLTDVLSTPFLHFAWPATDWELADQWRNFFDPVQAHKCVFLQHAPSVALDPEHFRRAAQVIQSQTFQIFTDVNTLVGKSQAFLDNFVRNLPRAIKAPGVARLTRAFCETPAIIVSAGPSLDKNVHELRAYTDKVLILSTDTALKPLLSAGVVPHFVLTGDPSYENYLHLQGGHATGTFLVAEATTYPDSFEEFDGRVIVCVYENSSLHALSDPIQGKGTLHAWGSVATMALDFALVLGCNPILFMGQDLAHSEGRTYCSSLHFEREWFAEVFSPEDLHSVWKKLGAGRQTVSLRDISGRMVETTDKLTAYWHWISKEIQKHPDVTFINATEGGILTDHVEIVSLREALFRYCSRNLSLRERARQAFLEAKDKTGPVSSIILRRLKMEAAELHKRMLQGAEICRDARQTDGRALQQALDNIKQDIYASRTVAPLVDSLNQLGNVTFLRRQAGLTRCPGQPPLVADLRAVYEEYFETVRLSLEKVLGALQQLERSLR